MSRRIPLLLAVLALASLSPAPAEEDKKESGTALFNGKDLSGWKTYLDPRAKDVKPEDVWSVKDGVIRCKGKPFGYLLTEKEYGNYVLTVEWRWPTKQEHPNSGVFVHVSGPDKIWPKGVEAQLYAGHAGDFWLVGDFKLEVDKERQDKGTSRHYYRIDKDTPVEKKPGEWNRYEITCRGNSIRLVVNGKLVNEGKNAEATKGKILLQSEGAPIEFRNIKLSPIRRGKE